MGEINVRVWKEDALGLVSRAQPSPRRIALLHAGVGIGLTLLLSAVNYLLSRQIAETGGLGGMQLRTTLETVQTLLELGLLIVLPVWQLGFTAAALRWSQGQAVTAQMLPQCFRKFGAVLRLQLLRLLLGTGLCFLVLQVGTLVYSLFPAGTQLLELMATLTVDMEQLTEGVVLTAAQQQAMMPYVIFCAMLCMIVAVVLEYRLRMAEFLLLEDARGSALASMAISFRLTHRNCGKLVQLDLQFWWYHLLRLVLVGISSADLVLAAMGIALPLPAEPRWRL